MHETDVVDARAETSSPPPVHRITNPAGPESSVHQSTSGMLCQEQKSILQTTSTEDASNTISCSGSSGWTSTTGSACSSSHSQGSSSFSSSDLLPMDEAPSAVPAEVRSLGDSKSFHSNRSPFSPSSARARLFVSEAVSDLKSTSSSTPRETDSKKRQKSKKKPIEIEITRNLRAEVSDDGPEHGEVASIRTKDEPEVLSLYSSQRSLDASDSETDSDENSRIRVDLHRMIRKKKWRRLTKAVESLLREGKDHERRSALTKCNRYGESTLHVAAWNAPASIVKSMLLLMPPDEAGDFVLEVDNSGNTVLHFACASLEHVEELGIVREIASIAPEALEMQNRDGDTPLHSLLSSKVFRQSSDFVMEAAAEDLITSLLGMNDSPGLLRNNEAATLLHVAIASEAYERVLMRLLQLIPESVNFTDDQGMLPIHYFASFGGTLPWTVAQEIIRLFPECIHCRTSNGDTPLHLLVENAHKFLNDLGILHRNTTKLAELLIGSSRSKDSPLTAQNSHKLTPLHIAALRDTPVQLTKLLLSFPGGDFATAVTAEFDATPVHLLCASADVSDRIDTLEALASSKACSMFDSMGRTPLVIAVQNERASKEVIAHLLEVYPRAATMRCKAGHLPVHLAVQKPNSDFAIVKLLLSIHPKIARAVNANRNTPLHEAAIHGAPIAVLSLLLERYPDAIQEMNHKGQRPLNCARERNAPTAVLDLLDETTMSLSSSLRPRHLSFSSGPSVSGGSMAEF